MFYVMPYKLGSISAKALATGLGLLRISGEKRLARRDTVINWGNRAIVPKSRWGEVKIINRPSAVACAINKLETFIKLTQKGIVTVPWTQNVTQAKTWLSSGAVVVVRKNLIGHGGQGIQIVEVGEIPFAQLYTKYVPKCHEYRVHVAFGQVIDVTKKKRRNDVPVSEFVRNYESGWVFCRDDISLPDKVEKLAIASVAALGLDFGALDVLYKERSNEAFVLEVNTSPGIEGTTLNKYIEVFKRRLYVG